MKIVELEEEGAFCTAALIIKSVVDSEGMSIFVRGDTVLFVAISWTEVSTALVEGLGKRLVRDRTQMSEMLSQPQIGPKPFEGGEAKPLAFRREVRSANPQTPVSYRYGAYFPGTDLVVWDMGERATGKPEGVEWL
jgi:hypothetical protein